MTKTFNMSILNNSFQVGFFCLPNGAKTQSLSPNKGSTIRSIANEAFSPFTIIPNAKIPDLSENRKEEREEIATNLLKRPKHKFNKVGALSNADKLMSAPLTM